MDGVIKKKRIRNPNWDDLEKSLLRDCCEDKLDIIENKCTDTTTNNKKKIAWLEIHDSFNLLNPKCRNLIEIKNQWRILRADGKKTNPLLENAPKEIGGNSHLKTAMEKRHKFNEELRAIRASKEDRDAALQKILREEHELKMTHMVNAEARAQKEHELKVKNLRLRNQLLKKQLQKPRMKKEPNDFEMIDL